MFEETIDIVAQPEIAFNNDLGEILLKNMIHFYCKSNTPISNALEIATMIKDVINFTCESLKQNIEKCQTLEEAQSFITGIELDSDKFRSSYMFKKYLRERGVWFPGKRFTIANRFVMNIDEIGDDDNMDTYHGIVLPVESQIKTFLSLPGVLNTMLNIQSKYTGANIGNTISHFCEGTLWRGIIEKNPGKTLIALMIYSDDFGIDNSRGPHSGDNAITAFYYRFPTLPGHLRSQLKFIFVAMLALAKHIKECTPDSALYMLVNIFTRLEVEGMDIVDENGELHKVHIVLTNCQGDNLGIHVMCGFAGFNAEFYCRFCLIPKSRCQQLCNNKDIELRSVEG